MIINTLIEFKLHINNQRILALDVSSKTIGVAISDEKLVMALPLKNIVRTKFLLDLDTIKKLYQDYKCGGIVIGLPLLLNNTEGARCQSIKDFTTLLLQRFDIPVFFENEQFSTRIVNDQIEKLKIKSKKPTDSFAATYFLQSLLERI